MPSSVRAAPAPIAALPTRTLVQYPQAARNACLCLGRPGLWAFGYRLSLDRRVALARRFEPLERVAKAHHFAHDNECGRLEAGSRGLVRHNLKAVRTTLLRENFEPFWTYRSATWAGKFLDRWCAQVMRTPIDPIKKVARMLRRHRPLLLNWFRARGQISAGAIEGLNNKAKLTTRKAYGFRSYRCIEIALYHTLGDLPKPQVTQKFC